MKKEAYRFWIPQVEPDDTKLSAMKRQLAGFEHLPKMSVVLVVSDLDEIWIKQSIESVLNQLYPNFELCIYDNASERPHVKEVLEEVAQTDDRTKVHLLRESEGLGKVYDRALRTATGEFVSLLGQGDELSSVALFRVAELLQHVEADVVYSDEDSIDISNLRSNPLLKPYWSPDLLLSTGYVGRLSMLRKDAAIEAGGFEQDFEAGAEHDLLLRISKRTERFYHLPRVLYHRRFYREEPAHEQPKQGPLLNVAGQALEREGARAALRLGITADSIRVVRDLPVKPTVSIVALVSDSEPAKHFEELEHNTSYPIHEAIAAEIGDSSSGVNAFAAQAANMAADAATGEYLLFTSGRVRPGSVGWLEELLSEAERTGVGSVGCKVLNSNGSIRHAGSFLGLEGFAGSPSSSDLATGLRFRPVLDYPFNPYAVTTDCMAIRRSTFQEIGGFDEDHLPAAFYDVDLSLRLREKGLLNVYTPYVSVVCEGAAQALPGVEEVEYVWTRWWSVLVKSFYYARSPLHLVHEGADDELVSFISTQ